MNSALDIALSGMRAAQLGLEVTSHNIANADVAGYTRQRAVLTSGTLRFLAGRTVDGGVQIEGIQRVSDRWVTRHIRHQMAEQGSYETLAGRLGEVESIFNETDGGGVSGALNELFGALSDVQDQPESQGSRIAAVSSAQYLASQIQGLRGQLNVIDRENRLELRYQVDQANTLLERVAQLNGQIAGGISARQNVSGLMDERELALQELATMAAVDVYISADERFATVSLGGVTLVTGVEAQQLQVNEAYGVYVEFEGRISSLGHSDGALGAMIQMRDDVIPRYAGYLDDLASNLISEFNAIHSAGQGLDGSTGIDLFVGTDASDINVNSVLTSNPSQFAAAPLGGAPGDSGNVGQMLALRQKAVFGDQTFEEYYESVIGSIGTETRSARAFSDGLEPLLQELVNRRDSVHGVSLDEEMTNLLLFQQAYAASARIVSAVDEMLQAVIQIGR